MLQKTTVKRPIAWRAWTRLVIASAARVVVLSLVGGLFWATAPNLIGWRPTTVMSDSMAPRFFTGDVAVSVPPTPEIETIGSILLVDDPDHPGRLRLHRLYDITPEGEIVTKGDANKQPDSSHVTQDKVRGVAVMRIPIVGLPLVWARYGEWLYVAMAGLGFLGLALLSTIDGDLRRAPGWVPPTTRRERRRRMRRDRIVPPILIIGSASVVAVMLAVTTGAHAAFASAVNNAASNWTASTDFACWATGTAPDSPFFYYRFDTWSNSTAPATDFSGGGRTGAVGTGTSRVAGACPTTSGGTSGTSPSPSLGFNGTTAATVTPSPTTAVASSNTAYSVEAWILTSSNTGRIVGWSNQRTTASTIMDRQLYMASDGRVTFGHYNSSNVVQTLASPNPLNDGAWHHVVATFATTGSQSGMRLYVDGSLKVSTAVTTVRSYTGFWRVGYDSLSGWPNTVSATSAFNGSLDNVAVYTTAALTAAQVSAHYAAGH